MGKKIARKSRGRPRSQDRSELTSALIAKQDAMSRKVASTIRRLLSTHLPADEVDYAWAWELRRIRRVIKRACAGAVPVLAAAAGENVAAVECAFKTLAYGILTKLGLDGNMPPPFKRPADPVLVPPEQLRASRSLAGARARLARLQVQRLNILERIAR